MLDFWHYAQRGDVRDFKLYGSVAKASFWLASAYLEGGAAQSISNALTLAHTTENGELALEYWGEAGNFERYLDDAAEDIEALITTLDAKEPLLARLTGETYEGITFLMQPSLKLLEAIDFPDDQALMFPGTVLRQLTFGFQQARIVQAKRYGRHETLPQLIRCADVSDYAQVLRDYDQLAGKIEAARLAVLHILITMEHPTAATHLMVRLPRLLAQQAGKAAQPAEWQSEPLIAMKRAALKVPEVNQLLKRCRDAYGAINRAGFKTLPAKAEVDRYEAGYSLLGEVHDAVRKFHDTASQYVESRGGAKPCFSSDLAIFRAAFETLEGSPL